MDKSSSVFLVACCGPKLAEPAPASDVYISALFKKSRTYVERRGRWFILSALHGLLEPLSVIEPYDVTLKTMSARQRRAWGVKVQKQMENSGLSGLSFVALAGADYVKPLAEAGIRVTQPMKGLGIGQQLQWLNQKNVETI